MDGANFRTSITSHERHLDQAFLAASATTYSCCAFISPSNCTRGLATRSKLIQKVMKWLERLTVVRKALARARCEANSKRDTLLFRLSGWSH